MLALLLLAAALVAASYIRAARRCHTQLQAMRARARRRADAALQIERIRIPWQRDTDRLHAALAPVLAAPATGGGFGDLLVAAERVRTAMSVLAPPAEELPL